MQLRRILMNAVDKGGGSGAPAPTPTPAPGQTPAPTPAPTPDPNAAPAGTPQAQGAALSPEAIAQIAAGVRDGVFAELRKAGVLGNTNPKPKPTPAPAPNGDPNAAATPPDISELRALDRALTRAGRTNLDETAYRRLERSFTEERPANVEQWVTDYFQGFGVPAAAASAQTPATPAPAGTPAPGAPNGQPSASDRGAPAAPKLPLEEQNLLTMSDADKQALIKQKGLKFFSELYTKQVGRMHVKTR